MEVGNFDLHAQGDGVFKLNPPFDFVLVVSFSCFGFYDMPQGSTSVFFIQQTVKQSTLWQGSCTILKQSEYCGKKILKKTKTGHFIYRFHKNLNGLYALDKSTSPHWEVA